MYSGGGCSSSHFSPPKLSSESRAGTAPSPAPRTRQAGCPRTFPCQRGILFFFFPSFFFFLSFFFPSSPGSGGSFPGSPAPLPARPRRGAQRCGRCRQAEAGAQERPGRCGDPAEGGGDRGTAASPPTQPRQPCPPRAGRTRMGSARDRLKTRKMSLLMAPSWALEMLDALD